MLIILEGAPNTGKTTLAKYLSKKFKMPIWPFLNRGDIFNSLNLDRSQGSFQISAESIAFTIAQLHSLYKFNLILDRFHLSNSVFGDLYGRHRSDKYKVFHEIEDLLYGNSLLINVSCNPTFSFSRNKNKQRNKIYTLQDYEELDSSFYHAYIESNIKYKTTIDSSKITQTQLKLKVSETVSEFILKQHKITDSVRAFVRSTK